MKIRAILLALAMAFAFQSGSARAALVDFTPTSTSHSYTINGTLASDATATFEFSVAGSTFTSGSTFGANIGTIPPTVVSSTPFTYGISSVSGSGATGFTTTSSSFLFSDGTNTVSPTPVLPIVMAVANLIDPAHVEVTFTNTGTLAAIFNSAISFVSGIGFGQLLLVSSVPLPAGLPLFAAALLALVAMAVMRKRNA